MLIGKDTRISGYMLESAGVWIQLRWRGRRVAGTVADPWRCLPTRAQRCKPGVVISASHNAYPDNGTHQIRLAPKAPVARRLGAGCEAALDGWRLCGQILPAWVKRADWTMQRRAIYQFCKSTFPQDLT